MSAVACLPQGAWSCKWSPGLFCCNRGESAAKPSYSLGGLSWDERKYAFGPPWANLSHMSPRGQSCSFLPGQTTGEQAHHSPCSSFWNTCWGHWTMMMSSSPGYLVCVARPRMPSSGCLEAPGFHRGVALPLASWCSERMESNQSQGKICGASAWLGNKGPQRCTAYFVFVRPHVIISISTERTHALDIWQLQCVHEPCCMTWSSKMKSNPAHNCMGDTCYWVRCPAAKLWDGLQWQHGEDDLGWRKGGKLILYLVPVNVSAEFSNHNVVSFPFPVVSTSFINLLCLLLIFSASVWIKSMIADR